MSSEESVRSVLCQTLAQLTVDAQMVLAHFCASLDKSKNECGRKIKTLEILQC